MKDWKFCTNIVKHDDAITFHTINDFSVAIGKFHFKKKYGADRVDKEYVPY